ncbi:MAG: hypothetical protein KatS3mg061_0943 [Dehalococcoidia bacterium]|nr:MAG: hypothetical protein KatS3mg061_0943 [Dehalococcoidia bacterium]
MSGVERISRLDERTVEVVTRAPDPLLLKKLTLFAVVPKAYTERIGAKEFVLKPVGSGPFKVREYVPDQRLVLEAFSEHAYRKPKLQQIVFRPIPESAQRLTGLRLGEIDVAQAISFEQAEQARREGFTLTSNDYQIMGIWFDTWGMDGNPGPIKDKRVRQAIAYALDRETLARTIFRGLTRPVGVMMTDIAFGYNPNLTPYRYDLAKARQLMAEAGYPNGFRVQVEFLPTTSEYQPVALWVQDQIKQIGIETDLAPVDGPTFGQKWYKRIANRSAFHCRERPHPPDGRRLDDPVVVVKEHAG